MNSLYPMQFQPIFKEKIWGGKMICEILKQPAGSLANCGELWAVSGLPDNSSVVRNGFLKGNTLEELCGVYLGDLLGEKVFEEWGEDFPLLCKFINAEQYLSVQVHPGNELAWERHGCPGKTEMWYVIDAVPGAQLISGFRTNVTPVEYEEVLRQNRLEEVLNYVPVRAGDAFWIPAGRIHSIGPGILLAEIQQSSDITYRIYDWGRIDASGLPRELHTGLALKAIDFDAGGESSTHPEAHPQRPVTVVKSDYFSVNLIGTEQRMQLDYSALDSFVILMGLGGNAVLHTDEGDAQICAGDAVLLPAISEGGELVPTGGCRLLEVFIEL